VGKEIFVVIFVPDFVDFVAVPTSSFKVENLPIASVDHRFVASPTDWHRGTRAQRD
jgi:hypothetical protein